MEGVEKIICCDRGANDNALAAAIMSRNNDNGMNAMWPALMMGGGMGMNTCL